ncbi:hypothetical protein E2C01_075519 [Portunus trituberculatus]|uniref:Uncharacterized protein n=1 Tax=Portunus trituberculatus TaxID=210409 RepID=A0A5B7I6A5_PORTR|nr:hypothetical protein [Portunus trituberculatus]
MSKNTDKEPRHVPPRNASWDTKPLQWKPQCQLVIPHRIIRLIMETMAALKIVLLLITNLYVLT